MKLTTKQAAFVAVYAGNATEAARLAGYKGSTHTLAVTGSDLLRKPEIAEAIQKRQTQRARGLIADREEVEEMLTLHVRDGEPDQQLKAASQLAKMRGWNLQKVELTGKVSLEQLIAEAESSARKDTP